MGWSSGVNLFTNIAETVSANVLDEDDREAIYEAMVSAFDAHDCDNLSDLIGEIDEILDSVLKDFYDLADDEDDDDGWDHGGRENFG